MGKLDSNTPVGSSMDPPLDVVEGTTARSITSLLKGIKNYLKTTASQTAGLALESTLSSIWSAIGNGTDTPASIIVDEDATDKSLVKLVKALKNLGIDESAFLSSLVSSLGDAEASPDANTLQARIKAIENVLGVTTGAGVVTDVDGTAQQYLRGLIKLWLTAPPTGAALASKQDTQITAEQAMQADIALMKADLAAIRAVLES